MNSLKAPTLTTILLLSGMAFLPIATAATVISENFETTTIGSGPTGWTTSNSATAACTFVADTVHALGTKDGKFTGTGDHSAITPGGPNQCATKYTTTGSTGDLCTLGNTFSLMVYVPSTIPIGDRIVISFDPTSPFTAPLVFSIDAAGSLNPYIVGFGASIGTLPLDAWSDLTFQADCTSASTTTFQIDSVAASIHNIQSYAINYNDIHIYALAERGGSPSLYPGATTWSFWTDNIGTATYIGLTPAATSALSATNVAGFDVSKNGAYVVIRNGAGTHQHVLIENGQTLAQQADTGDGLCNRLNGVLAIADEGPAYISCNSTQHPNSVSFVNAFGANYPFSPGCTQTNYNCDGVISYTAPGPYSTTDNDALSAMAKGLNGEFYATGSNSGNQQVLSGFNIAFTESSTGSNIVDANLGWTSERILGSPATVEHYHPITLPTTTTNLGEICGYGNLKVFKALSGQPVKGYTITLNSNANSGTDQIPAPTFVQTFTGTTDAMSNAASIACASDRIIAVSSTQLTIWNYATNSLVLTMPITNGAQAAISGNGTYAAWDDTTGKVHLINGNTGAELTFITMPEAAANFHGNGYDSLRMDNCAQNLYLQSLTKTYRYNITGNTTGHPIGTSASQGCFTSSGIGSSSSSSTSACVFGCGSGTTHTTASDSAAGLNGFCSSLMGDSDGSLFLCGLILAAFVFLAVVAAFGALSGSMAMPALIAGAVFALGEMVFNVVAGIWGLGAAVIMALLSAAIVLWFLRKMFFGGTGNGGAE